MKNGKKLLLALVLAMTLAAVAVSALAADVRYVNTSKLNVYKTWDTDSKVIKTLKGGASVLIEDIVDMRGKWAMILVEDTKHGGQMEGFVQTKYLSSEIPQKYCKHDWGKWKVTTEATCTEKGSRSRTCKICGKVDKESIKALGHEWGRWKVTKEATCVKEGERTRTCAVCGKKETERYLDEHTYGAWTMTKEPTCTAKGARERTCKVCGHVDTQALDKLPHEYEWTVTVEATDHSAGVRAKICKNCGYDGGEESFDPEGTLRRGERSEAVRAMQQLLVEQGYLNAGGADGIFGGGTEKALIKYQSDRSLNPDGIGWPQTIEDLQHDYGPWETVKEMTRAEAGERVRVCRGCGYEQREIIEPGTVFERGRRGEDVRSLQQIVKQLGYDAGGFDGIYGRKLDAALAGFAEANGLVVEDGKIRPSDVDALVNAWLDATPADTWMGEGSADTPVNLALSVTQTAEADESGMASFEWSLTNLGGEKATFTALLLDFGDDPDFKSNNLVMVLDGVELKANAGNSTSGAFTADVDWGEGSLNFAAMAISEKTGAKWLSNVVAFENETVPAEKTVAPLALDIDVNRLPDGAYPVSFNRGDVLSGASGIYMNGVRVYTQDRYDSAEIEALEVGDTIVVEGEEVPVLSLERDEDAIIINDEQDARAFILAKGDDADGYTIRGMDDLSTFTEQGVASLVLADSATFTDAWDIEKEPVTVEHDGIVAAMQSSENEYFVQYNTTVRVEAGEVVEISRVYVP